jgi:hypothetical protein
MNEFFEKVEELGLPPEQIARLMAREHRKLAATQVDG